jgi:hypothetical protein
VKTGRKRLLCTPLVTGRCLALICFETTVDSPHYLYKKATCVCYLRRSTQHTARHFQISSLRSRIIGTPIKRTEQQQFVVCSLLLVFAQRLLIVRRATYFFCTRLHLHLSSHCYRFTTLFLMYTVTPTPLFASPSSYPAPPKPPPSTILSICTRRAPDVHVVSRQRVTFLATSCWGHRNGALGGIVFDLRRKCLPRGGGLP